MPASVHRPWLHRVCRWPPRHSRGYHGRAPANSTAAAVCCRPTTTTRHTRRSDASFLLRDDHRARERRLARLDVVLEPVLRNPGDTSHASERHAFEEESINRRLGGVRNDVMGGRLDKLTLAALAHPLGLAVGDPSVFDDSRSLAPGAWHGLFLHP